ncbi:MAG TPA: hypothetical protein VFE53_26490 [Mucilaginibacter sp.]|jgi:hypothetical protein|nr:hypothetical protein [Mucilaginibacter sp.]
MKRLFIPVLTLLACSAFSQTVQKNGVIYKEHPYIDVVHKIVSLYPKSNWDELSKLYSDTVTFTDYRNYKQYRLDDAKKYWLELADNWEQLTIVKLRGPDGFAYEKDPFSVVAWFMVTMINKKTLKRARFTFMLNDEFNKNGKVSAETFFYNMLPVIEAMK